jgi:hypothetical protein
MEANVFVVDQVEEIKVGENFKFNGGTNRVIPTFTHWKM